MAGKHKALKHCTITHHGFMEISSLVQLPKAVTTCQMSRNRLKGISGTLFSSTLTSLDLSYNHLLSITNFIHLKNLSVSSSRNGQVSSLTNLFIVIEFRL